MAVSQITSATSLNVDPPGVYQFEAKSLMKDSFNVLHELYQNQELCDVEIKVGNKSFKCHRVVLVCASLYFRAMFKSEMAESHQDVVTIQDIDEDAMEKLIEFAYTAKVRITTDTVHPLLFAAAILQIDSVAEACATFMKSHLHPTNCIEVRRFSLVYSYAGSGTVHCLCLVCLHKGFKFDFDCFSDVADSFTYNATLIYNLLVFKILSTEIPNIPN